MELTRDNLEKIFNYIESKLEDDNGGGEFDEETPILSAVERTIEMFKESKERALPFKCEILDKEPQEVKNIFSGAACTIQPDAVAVYDTIMGMQVMPNPDWEIVRKGIDWFIEHEPKAYMVLLD